MRFGWKISLPPPKESLVISVPWENDRFVYDYWGGHVVSVARKNPNQTSTSGNREVQVIKILRNSTNLSLKNTKECVEGNYDCSSTQVTSAPSVSLSTEQFYYVIISFRGNIYASCIQKYQYICDSINR